MLRFSQLFEFYKHLKKQISNYIYYGIKGCKKIEETEKEI